MVAIMQRMKHEGRAGQGASILMKISGLRVSLFSIIIFPAVLLRIPLLLLPQVLLQTRIQRKQL